MKARNLVSPQPSVREGDPASETAALLARADVRGAMVLDANGDLVGILTDSILLRYLLPAYVHVDESLAGVLEEKAADALWQRLEGKVARDLLPDDRDRKPLVAGEDTLIEVAAAMVRTRLPLVGVREHGRLIGGITIDQLLAHLLRGR